VIAVADLSSALGGASLGMVNGAVGVAFALVLRRVLPLPCGLEATAEPSGLAT
jgi:hypothetical protein